MHRDKRGFAIAVAGYACFLALNSFSLWGFSFLPQGLLGKDSASLWSTSLSLANIACFFALAARARFRPQWVRGDALFIATLLVSAGLILLLGEVLAPNRYLSIASGICMGAGTTFLFICWIRLFSRLGLRQAKWVLVLGSACSFIPFLLYLAVPSSGILFVVFVMAFATLLLIHAARNAFSPDDALSREEPTASRGSIRMLAKPVLCVTMIGAVAAVVSGISGMTGSDPMPSFETQALIIHSENMVASIILAICWLAAAREITLTAAYAVVFPILATIFLLFTIAPASSHIILSAASSIAFVVFSMVVPMQSISISEKTGLKLDEVYGLLAGSLYLAEGVGSIIIAVAMKTATLQATQFMAIIFLLLYACSLVMFFVLRKQSADHDAIAAEDSEPSQNVDFLSLRAKNLAGSHGFSERQEDVLELLVHGYDVPSIAKKLFISENTVRTHLKRIYMLLDVHSKQEIIDSVNSASEKPRR
jgi:DNA-binding CsgD family transcriptional regulator